MRRWRDLDSARATLLAELREHALVIGEVTLSSRPDRPVLRRRQAGAAAPGRPSAPSGELVAAEAAERGATAVGGMTMGADPLACAAIGAEGGDGPASPSSSARSARSTGCSAGSRARCSSPAPAAWWSRTWSPPAAPRCTAIERILEEGLEVAGVVSRRRPARRRRRGDRGRGRRALPGAGHDRRALPGPPGPRLTCSLARRWRGREITGGSCCSRAAARACSSVVMHWPLVLNLGETIPKDLGDPLPQSWQVAWGGHALAEPAARVLPVEPVLARVEDSLAFGDALIGYAPAGPDRRRAPRTRSSATTCSSSSPTRSAFLGAYLLARELGIGPGGAAVAGAAFAFAPFRLEQDGHMQVISSGGIPLALAMGVRGIRLRSAVVAVRRLGRRRLAALDRVRDRPPVRLPARRLLIAIGADRLVAPRPPGARPARC